MPDNKKSVDIDAMRCDAVRRHQLENFDGHELIYTGVFYAHGVSLQSNQWGGIPST